MSAKFTVALAAAATLLAGTAAQAAATVDWTQWSSNTTGVAGGVTVTYSGEMVGLTTAPFWTPVTTWQDVEVANAPLQADGAIALLGGPNTGTDTITFSSAVVNPVFAIWSLGQGAAAASFNFLNSPSFVLAGGGPNIPYGGQSITRTGDNVYGVEGNGLVVFQGTFTSISFTTPSYENWYGFTVGINAGAVPEPAAWALMLVGFGGLGAMLRNNRRRMAATA